MANAVRTSREAFHRLCHFGHRLQLLQRAGLCIQRPRFIRMEQPGRRKIGHAPAAGVRTLQRIQTDPPRSFADQGAACGGVPLRRGRLLLEVIRMEAVWRVQLPQQRWIEVERQTSPSRILDVLTRIAHAIDHERVVVVERLADFAIGLPAVAKPAGDVVRVRQAGYRVEQGPPGPAVRVEGQVRVRRPCSISGRR